MKKMTSIHHKTTSNRNSTFESEKVSGLLACCFPNFLPGFRIAFCRFKSHQKRYLFSGSLPCEIIFDVRGFCTHGRAYKIHAHQINSFKAKLRIPLVNRYQKRKEIFLRYTLCCAIFSCMSIALIGQSLGRQLIGSASGAARIGDLQLTWSIGEVRTGHWKTANGQGQLTEGFHQPGLMPLNEGVNPSLVQVVPNPVRNMLNLYIPGDSREEWTITLGDVNGKILLRHTGLTAGNTAFDLGRLPSGVYFLTVYQDTTGEVRQTLKVVKL